MHMTTLPACHDAHTLHLCLPPINPSTQIRQSAGLLLKNNLSQQYDNTAPELKQNIQVSGLDVFVHHP